MRIGTTPKHIFNLPIDTDDIKTLEITYEQGGTVKLQKKKDECECDGKVVTVKLTQEDTFKFHHNEYIRVQVRVLLNDGSVLESEIEKVDAEECLSSEVLE